MGKIRSLGQEGKIEVVQGAQFPLAKKIQAEGRDSLIMEETPLKYIEISDVTKYGLITSYQVGTLDQLPSRGEHIIREGDILFAINNSSRGTVVLVPKAFDDAVCTSGFYVIRPRNKNEGYLLWYALRSELCRKQVYYLAQTASQPELKIDGWNNHFLIPFPKGSCAKKAILESERFFEHMEAMLKADRIRFTSQ